MSIPVKNNKSIKHIFVKEPGKVFSVPGFFNFRRVAEGDTTDHLHQLGQNVLFTIDDIIVNTTITNIAFKIHIENLHFLKEWLVEQDYRLQDVLIVYSIERLFHQKLKYFNRPRLHITVLNDDGMSKYFI